MKVRVISMPPYPVTDPKNIRRSWVGVEFDGLECRVRHDLSFGLVYVVPGDYALGQLNANTSHGGDLAAIYYGYGEGRSRRFKTFEFPEACCEEVDEEVDDDPPP